MFCRKKQDFIRSKGFPAIFNSLLASKIPKISRTLIDTLILKPKYTFYQTFSKTPKCNISESDWQIEQEK